MATLIPRLPEPTGRDPQSSIVRAIAVVGVIFGVLGLSCLPFNLGEWITYGWPLSVQRQTTMENWCLISTFIGLSLSAMLMLGGLGAYRFSSWGRDLLLLWAVLSLAYGLVGIFFWGQFLLPWLRGKYANMVGPDEVGGLIAWMIGTALSVFVLKYLTRADVRAVFEFSRSPR